MAVGRKTTAEASAEFRAACLTLLAALPGMDLALRRANRLAVKLGFGDRKAA